jgi:hypothetical protein
MKLYNQLKTIKNHSKMADKIDYAFEEYKIQVVELLEFLRSRKMHYGDAKRVLEGAQKLLHGVAEVELEGLPIAEGISYYETSSCLDCTKLMTASKRLNEVAQ